MIFPRSLLSGIAMLIVVVGNGADALAQARRLSDGATWSGPIDSNGKPFGNGTYAWPNGDRFVGEIRGNLNIGVSTTLGGTRREEGLFRDGILDGPVTVRHGGEIFEGSYVDGKAHGRGSYVTADGQRYVGQWKNGQRSGTGTLTWPDGSRYEGDFANDKINGNGVLTKPDGNRTEGFWRNGAMIKNASKPGTDAGARPTADRGTHCYSHSTAQERYGIGSFAETVNCVVIKNGCPYAVMAGVHYSNLNRVLPTEIEPGHSEKICPTQTTHNYSFAGLCRRGDRACIKGMLRRK